MNPAVVGINQLVHIAEELRVAGKKLVLTNGCFDLLHVGHTRYLQAARALGDALVVAVNGDDSIRALKGEGRPLNREADRAEILAALACVDHVCIFHETRATSLLLRVRPSVYVKGGDYRPETLHSEERDALKKVGAEIKIVPFEIGYSTSRLLERMNGR